MFSNTKTMGTIIIILTGAVIVLSLIVIFMAHRLGQVEHHVSKNGELVLLLHESNKELVRITGDHEVSMQEIQLILEGKE